MRIELLKDSTIVFFCAGYPGKRFIYELASKRGINSIIIDNHDSWARSLVREGVISHFIGVDMSQPADMVFDEALAALNSLDSKPNGVCTFVELSVSIAARLADAMGLPCSNPLCVDAARDKSQTRTIMKQRGLPNVRHTIIRSEDDLASAAATIGFPAVLKPISGAASLGVQKVSSADELLSVYRNVQGILSSLIVSAGALERRTDTVNPDGSPSSNRHSGVDASAVIDVSVMMEEYLDGVEVDVDLLLSGGECRYANVIDNGPTHEPYFGETWAALPSLLPQAKVDELRSVAIESAKALGFTDGVFHVELKYTSRGPRLIEVNARMGGGPTRMIHKLVAGIDLVLEQFFVAVGIPSRPPYSSTPLTHIAYAFINSRQTGVVDSIEFVKEYGEREGVVWMLPYVKPYEQFVGPEDGHPSWLGDIVVRHPDGHEALCMVQALEKEIAEDFGKRSVASLVTGGKQETKLTIC